MAARIAEAYHINPWKLTFGEWRSLLNNMHLARMYNDGIPEDAHKARVEIIATAKRKERYLLDG